MICTERLIWYYVMHLVMDKCECFKSINTRLVVVGIKFCVICFMNNIRNEKLRFTHKNLITIDESVKLLPDIYGKLIFLLRLFCI